MSRAVRTANDREGVRIGLAPCSPSHLRKNLATIRRLESQGARAVVLCLDPVLPDRLASRSQIEEIGLEAIDVDPRGFRPSESWLREFMQSRRLRAALDEVLDRADLDALVLFAAGIFVPSFLAVRSRERSLPTVLIPDGVVLPTVPDFRPSARERISFALRRALYHWTPRGAGNVDRVTAADETARGALIALGIAPGSIDVVGSAEYEELDRRRPELESSEFQSELRSRLGLPARGPVILYAHQSIHDESTTRDVIRRLADAARPASASVLVKLHPLARFEAARLERWAEQECPGVPLRVCLDTCASTEAASLGSVCVTAYSTVAVEALVFGRPLVLLEYLAPRYRLDLVNRYGVGQVVGNPGQVAQAITRVLEGSEAGANFRDLARKALVAEFAGFDGDSAARAARVILSVAGDPSARPNACR